MIINQVSGGSGPDVLDNELIFFGTPLVVLFREDTAISSTSTEAFSGERMSTNGGALMGDKHLYQEFKKMGISTTESGFILNRTVSLLTHATTSSKLSGISLFNKTSVGAKKGSGTMYIYLDKGSTITKPYSGSYGIFTKFTFDFTAGKDIITPERTSVGGNDIGTIRNEGYYVGVIGYILRATFE